MQAGEEDDDPELTTLLEQALSSSSDSEAAQALGHFTQARLTEASAVPSLVARLWHTFFAAAAGNGQEDDVKKEPKSKVLHAIGWDLFEALVPWARGGGNGGDGGSSCSSSSAMDSSSAPSSPSLFLLPLLTAVLGLHSGRERLLMLQEALALAPRRTHPSFVPWLLAQMPPALAAIAAPQRKAFLDSVCRVWRKQAGKALATMEEGEGGEGEDEEEEQEQEQEEERERRPTGAEARAILVAVLEAVEALLSKVLIRENKEKGKTGEEAAAAVVEMGYVIGVLLSMLLMVAPLPPPPPPPSSSSSSSSSSSEQPPEVHQQQEDSFHFAERVTALLARALTSTPLLSFESLLRHHRTLQLQDQQPKKHNKVEKNNNNEDEDLGKPATTAAAAPAAPLTPASAVASTPFAWETAGLSLATYHLLVHPPSLPPSLLPRVLAPAYVAQLLAVPAALLLQKSQAAPCGLALLERGTLALLPSQGGGGEGVLECRALGASRSSKSSSSSSEGGKEEAGGGGSAAGAGAGAGGGREDTWVTLIRGLTGCMVFLADDAIRQRAYLAIPRVLALLTYRSRYSCLASALPRSHHPTIQALLISYAQKTFLLATAPTYTPPSLPPSPWHQLARLRVFYAPVLSRACAAKPEILVSWAATNTNTTTTTSSSSSSAPTGTEGQLDALLSALNFLRFLRLKGWVEEGGEEEGEWWPKLRELQGRVGGILGKPHQQLNAFRLAMVEEVLGVLLVEEGWGEEKMEVVCWEIK